MQDDRLEKVKLAADAIASADALLITAGAGMGVDSGLPDFRGNKGFWKAYPPLEGLGISFFEMANPIWFSRDPALAWGFYGHRFNLYRETTPHQGFEFLRHWAQERSHGSFVFTSNVDGQFQTAGFDHERVLECHGSINHLQCTVPCCHEIWPIGDPGILIDDETFRASTPPPTCPECGGLARPNILMFNDWHWVPHRTSAQENNFDSWIHDVHGSRLVVIEIGAGSAVPTVRMTSERAVAHHDGTLVRINPREPQTPHGQIGIEGDALEILQDIDAQLGSG